MALNGGRRFEFTHAISLLVDCVARPRSTDLDGLSAGGAIEQCGWLKDRYGVSWQITPRRGRRNAGRP